MGTIDTDLNLDDISCDDISCADISCADITVSGEAIIDKDTTITTGASTGLKIDYDHTGIAASLQTVTGVGLDIDMNCESVTHIGYVTNIGIDLDMVAGTAGSQIQTGISMDLSGGDLHTGLIIIVPDGANDSHITLQSAATNADKCKIRVIEDGETIISTEENGGGSTAHLTLDVDGNLILDPASGITKFYLSGDTDDLCTLTVAADGATTIATADSDGAVGHLTLDVDGFLKLDAHAYDESEGVQFLLAGTHVGDITGHHSATNFRLYENIGASTDDYFQIATGASGSTIIKTEDAGGAVGHLKFQVDGHVEFYDCAVGFDLEFPTYDASDTDVSFVTGNKQFVTFDGGNITDLNLIFPDISGNFVLLVKQDGTGSRTITNYKAWDLVNSDAADGSATVKFAGGSNPDLTDDANHVDIISFFWDADNEIAYGVASLDFQF